MTEFTENTPTVSFEDPGGGTIFAIRVCPNCGRFLKTGDLFTDQEGGHVEFKGWLCAKCGEVSPDWDRY